MSTASDALAERLRPLLPGTIEKRMFGGIGFMLAGNMLAGTTAGGELLIRVGPDRMDEALSRRGAHLMHMGSRAMSGFVAVTPSGLSAADLSGWLDFARTFVETLPPK